jgi:hypothetical protein
MDDRGQYEIVVKNGVDEAALNASSPVQIAVVCVAGSDTHLHLHADQSGLIGLLRHLHQQGYLLLAVVRKPVTDLPEDEHDAQENGFPSGFTG